MNVLEHLREWSASSDEWEEICNLQYVSADLPPGPDRDQVCGRMAKLLESHADRMERSRLVRAFASAFTPEGHRADAAVWRSGRNPWAEEP